MNTTLDTTGDVHRFLDSVRLCLLQLGLSDFAYHPLIIRSDAPPLGHYAPELRRAGCSGLLCEMALQHAMTGHGMVLRSDIDPWLARAPLGGTWLDEYRLLTRTLDELGYYDFGVLIPGGQHRAALWLSGRNVPIAQLRTLLLGQRPAVEQLAREIHAAAIAYFPAAFNLDPLSSPSGRPLRLLQVLARENVTLSEAAQRLHISVSTANQHIATAKRLLGSRTTVHAIVTAARRGLITL